MVKRNFGVDVRKALEKKGKKELKSAWYFGTPKTLTSNRTIHFRDTLYKVLKDAKRQKNINRLKYGEYYTEHYLKKETDEKGEPMYRVIPAARALECSMPKADMVCVKENGANVKDVQERLGHTDIQTTLNTYVHNTDQMRKETVDIFENVVKLS